MYASVVFVFSVCVLGYILCFGNYSFICFLALASCTGIFLSLTYCFQICWVCVYITRIIKMWWIIKGMRGHGRSCRGRKMDVNIVLLNVFLKNEIKTPCSYSVYLIILIIYIVHDMWNKYTCFYVHIYTCIFLTLLAFYYLYHYILMF